MKTARAGRLLAVTILAGLLAASLAIAQKDDQADVLMQAAHQKQLVEGQLEDAIQLYKRIVQEHPGSRAVAAKALLEMGRCYEKLGNTEARKAYERLLRDYGDQKENRQCRAAGACTPHEDQAWTRWSRRNQRRYVCLVVVAEGKKKG